MASEQSQPQTLAQVMSQIETLDASLGDRLRAYRENSARLRPDVAQAYDAIVERLGILERGGIGPKIGEPMPGFTLPGDVSGSDKYYREDLVEPPIRARQGLLAVPAGPGLGVAPDEERIARGTLRALTLGAGGA